MSREPGDAELVRRTLAGDGRAFDHLVRRFSRGMLAVAWEYTETLEDHNGQLKSQSAHRKPDSQQENGVPGLHRISCIQVGSAKKQEKDENTGEDSGIRSQLENLIRGILQSPEYQLA